NSTVTRKIKRHHPYSTFFFSIFLSIPLTLLSFTLHLSASLHFHSFQYFPLHSLFFPFFFPSSTLLSFLHCFPFFFPSFTLLSFLLSFFHSFFLISLLSFFFPSSTLLS